LHSAVLVWSSVRFVGSVGHTLLQALCCSTRHLNHILIKNIFRFVMVQLRCTNKVQKYLGVKQENLSEISTVESCLGHWYVNLFTQNRRNVAIYMNEKTLLSFVLIGVKKSKSEQIIEGFPAGLIQLLEFEGFNDSQIRQVVASLNEVQITKTNSRSLLGNMNDLVHMYKYLIDMDGGLEYCDVGSVIYRINRTPQRMLNWAFSIETASVVV
ncbi:DUF6933 domain-containing protein, partial [Photobacterium alginatilyticum]|uniref:DUF6933 domain-containing protein n=1 Tax=Photobacterium alginatilyticum TaxID=1775171 RepID=UPI0040684B12